MIDGTNLQMVLFETMFVKASSLAVMVLSIVSQHNPLWGYHWLSGLRLGYKEQASFSSHQSRGMWSQFNMSYFISVINVQWKLVKNWQSIQSVTWVNSSLMLLILSLFKWMCVDKSAQTLSNYFLLWAPNGNTVSLVFS